jgi:Ribbon-helix-helix domain
MDFIGYARVYTRHYTMKPKRRKARRPARKGKAFSLWLQPLEKETLKQLSDKTGVDQTKLVRRGIALLFDAFNRGQLELGFPETIRPHAESNTRNATL